jgi:hypothetical protein
MNGEEDPLNYSAFYNSSHSVFSVLNLSQHEQQRTEKKNFFFIIEDIIWERKYIIGKLTLLWKKGQIFILLCFLFCYAKRKCKMNGQIEDENKKSIFMVVLLRFRAEEMFEIFFQWNLKYKKVKPTSSLNAASNQTHGVAKRYFFHANFIAFYAQKKTFELNIKILFYMAPSCEGRKNK